MKKMFHQELRDEFIPKPVTDPVYVYSCHCAFSEIQEVVTDFLHLLYPFNGSYSLHVEFTEPNADPRFVLGHVGVVISVYAETEEAAKVIYDKCWAFK